MMIVGALAVIDISDAQGGNISWQSVAASGVRGAWIKASEGIGSPSKFFRQNVAAARAAGVLAGAYHYLRIRLGAGAVQDAAKQANEFCDLLLSAGAHLRPMVDVEWKYNEHATSEQSTSALRQFVAVVFERLGVVPIIYTSPGEWSSLGLSRAFEFAVCPLWIASVGPAGAPSQSAAPVPDPWKSAPRAITGEPVPLLHQFSWKGHVPGIPVDVDMSHFFGTEADLAHLEQGSVMRAAATKAFAVGAVVLVIGGATLLLYGLATKVRKDQPRVLRSA